MSALRTFPGALLLTLLVLLLTFKLKVFLGWSPDLLLPVLAVAAFFLDIYSLSLLLMLAAWVVNWQLGFPPELWLLLAVPLAAWVGKRFLPVAPWLTLGGIIVAGEAALYAVSAPGIFFDNIGFILLNTVFAALLGLILLDLIKYAYGRE